MKPALLLGWLLTLGLPGGPGVFVSVAQARSWTPVEADAREIPWQTLGRLALQAGNLPPQQRSLTGAELAELLGGASSADPEARWWLQRILADQGGRSWRLRWRVLSGFTTRGSIIPQEAGLSWASGWGVSCEPLLEWQQGRYWAAFSGRLHGRLVSGGETLAPDDPLGWSRWSLPSGLEQVHRARFDEGDWSLDAPRLLVGAQLGHWSLSAGWAPRRTGPGIRGGLLLDQNGPSFPALTARRTTPFHWSGIMTHAAPDHLLLRAGLLSRQTIQYQTEWGLVRREAEPWFMQWLVGWDVTTWFRTTFSQTTMAAPREGTLWPDLLQINFPVIGTTWREMDSGPVTDRLFGVMLEFRWAQAPLLFLPGRAGRAYWDYGGTDFLPSGPGGVVPQISIPASVAGVELIGRHWDLVLEYAETFHDKGQWYSNSGFRAGYSHEGWLMGHLMGGGNESFHLQVRLRPDYLPLELRFSGDRINWNHDLFYRTRARRESMRLEVLRRQAEGRGGLPGKLVLERLTERIEDPWTEARWWRGYVVLGF